MSVKMRIKRGDDRDLRLCMLGLGLGIFNLNG
jgi:hypothetical protein